LLQLARAFLGFVHDVEIVGLVADASDLVDATAEEIAEAKALAGQAGRGLLPAFFDRWARAVEEAAKSQTPRLVLEMAVCDLCTAEPLLPLGDLLKRLEDLEGRVVTGGGGGGGARPAAEPARGPSAPASS